MANLAPVLKISPVSSGQLLCAIEPHFQAIFGRNPPPRLEDFSVRLLICFGESVAGWHFGGSKNGETYMMTNTALLPEFRRLGVYSRFLQLLCDQLRASGYRRVISRHRPDNVAVLEAKKKAGFVEIGREIDPALGPLVTLARGMDG